MKKIIISIFVFALLASTVAYAERGTRYNDDDDNDTATSTRSERRDKNKERNGTSTRSDLKNKNASSTVDLSCVSKAVSVREDSISSAWTTLDDEMTNILSDRKLALITAWAITDSKERRSEVKEIWKTSKADKKSASSDYKQTKKSAWSEFKKSAKKCGGSDGMDASGESEAGEKIEI